MLVPAVDSCLKDGPKTLGKRLQRLQSCSNRYRCRYFQTRRRDSRRANVAAAVANTKGQSQGTAVTEEVRIMAVALGWRV